MVAPTTQAEAMTGTPWEFLSTFIWQLLAISVIVFFRKEIKELLVSIASLKFGPAEFVFQRQTPEAAKLGADTPKVDTLSVSENLDQLVAGPDGFLEASTVQRVVADSTKLVEGGKVQKILLLFATEMQRTWLVTTQKHLFYVLDDRSTRSKGRLIQRKQDINDLADVRTAASKSPTAGVVYIGDPPGWYYSRAFFPNPEILKERLLDLATTA